MSLTATVRVKPWSADQGEFVLVNECDFDPERHELIDPPQPAQPSGAQQSKKGSKAAPKE